MSFIGKSDKFWYRVFPKNVQSMTLPDFMCIGAQKAGTSWLHHVVAQHPDIIFQQRLTV